MEFLQIADLHYRNEYPAAENGYLSIFKHMTSPIELLKKGLERINYRNLEFVLICGDLTENGGEEDYSALKKQLDQVFGKIPYVVTLGNHDCKSAFQKVWYGENGEESTYGTVHHFSGIMVIAVDNSSEENGNGIITKEHCSWMKRYFLEAAKQQEKVILMMHHPMIFDRKTPIPIVQYPKEFIKLIKNYRPAAILCGHTHNQLVGSYEDILYATCGSMSFKGYQQENGNVLFKQCASMNLCHMEENYISIEEVMIDVQKQELGLVKM